MHINCYGSGKPKVFRFRLCQEKRYFLSRDQLPSQNNDTLGTIPEQSNKFIMTLVHLVAVSTPYIDVEWFSWSFVPDQQSDQRELLLNKKSCSTSLFRVIFGICYKMSAHSEDIPQDRGHGCFLGTILRSPATSYVSKNHSRYSSEEKRNYVTRLQNTCIKNPLWCIKW